MLHVYVMFMTNLLCQIMKSEHGKLQFTLIAKRVKAYCYYIIDIMISSFGQSVTVTLACTN